LFRTGPVGVKKNPPSSKAGSSSRPSPEKFWQRAMKASALRIAGSSAPAPAIRSAPTTNRVDGDSLRMQRLEEFLEWFC
jgi:hypothetical protein